MKNGSLTHFPRQIEDNEMITFSKAHIAALPVCLLHNLDHVNKNNCFLLWGSSKLNYAGREAIRGKTLYYLLVKCTGTGR
jgi:hypothetical protein